MSRIYLKLDKLLLATKSFQEFEVPIIVNYNGSKSRMSLWLKDDLEFIQIWHLLPYLSIKAFITGCLDYLIVIIRKLYPKILGRRDILA